MAKKQEFRIIEKQIWVIQADNIQQAFKYREVFKQDPETTVYGEKLIIGDDTGEIITYTDEGSPIGE